MLTTFRIVIIIEEVDSKLRCVLIRLFGQGTNIFACCSAVFCCALTTDFIKNRHTLLVGLRIAYTLTAGTPHIVHANGCQCLDAMIYLCCTDRVTSSATDTDHAYLIGIDGRMVGEEIDSCTEIFYPHFGRFDVTGITAAFAIIGRIESQCHVAQFCQLAGMKSRSLFLDTTEGMTDDDGGVFL